MSPPTLTVVVPTYRRPQMLAACLDAVLPHVRAAREEGLADVGAVLVIDNDPDGGAREAVAAYAPDVRYLHEPTPGIAAVRARALREVGTRLLSFIDDDELPCVDWLVNLLAARQASGAQVVNGRVEAVIDGAAHAWITAGDLFGGRPRLPTGTVIPVAAAGNMLLDVEWLAEHGITFDDRLGLGGGEDTLLSFYVTAAGGTIVWCDDSLAEDHVPAARLTRRWLARRFFSQGHANVVVQLLAPQGAGHATRIRARAMLDGLARMIYGAVRFTLGSITGRGPRRGRDLGQGMRLGCRGAGMTWAALGRGHQEYSRRAR